ncbi:MAG: CRISPR-associated RAMP protein Csx7 [Coleofasciculus sp. G1-WW12-02]|uniref:type III CRISPR-associated RAMP protein Csx7 n=1 Tax=Coleofasciculus sp. G1-WW12-02 TaxID=3068483 RepID=UPI0032F9D082
MFDRFKNRLEISGTLTTVTALRISSGRSTEPIGSDLPVIKDALGKPLIPGASFKGALRSRLESFLRGIDPSLAANPTLEAESSIPAKSIRDSDNRILRRGLEQIKQDIEEELKDDPEKQFKMDKKLTKIIIDILKHEDLTSHLFGSPWLASKFQVRDLMVLSNYWFGQYQERDGVAIDRDTETAADGKLYDFQVVPAGTPFEFKAVVENADDWELGLLMIGLHQFETEQILLGGGRSRGLGVVKLEIDKMHWFDARDENDPDKIDANKLLDYLKKTVNNEDSVYEDSKGYKDQWVQSLIDHLKKLENQNAEVNAR